MPPTTEATPMMVMAKVTVSPKTIPNGRRRPPAPAAESKAGSTGSTHGEIAVPAPTTKANRSSSSTRRLCTVVAELQRAHDLGDCYGVFAAVDLNTDSVRRRHFI